MKLSKKVQAKLDLHLKWLNGEASGKRANLRWANLRGADLQGANLPEADLQGANLQGADLRWANLQGAKLPSSTMLLLCTWGAVSAELTTELMRYDASNHPNPSDFDKWAQGGNCPYQGGFDRCARFIERRRLWEPGNAKTARELVLMLFNEKKIKYSEGI